jgi:hypothetical protein
MLQNKRVKKQRCPLVTLDRLVTQGLVDPLVFRETQEPQGLVGPLVFRETPGLLVT